MTYRIIQWSTGNAGRWALRSAIQSPDLEIVGVWVHSPQKVGVDAGVLAGLDPIGVPATDNMDDLLAREADVVCYTASGDLRPTEALADICRILESGKNVVATSLVALTHISPMNESMARQLEAACTSGGTTVLFSGIDPGFAIDLVPAALLTAAHKSTRSGCERSSTTPPTTRARSSSTSWASDDHSTRRWFCSFQERCHSPGVG